MDSFAFLKFVIYSNFAYFYVYYAQQKAYLEISLEIHTKYSAYT